ncbi:hypothetical protein [Thioclava sp. GXIMD4216]|uniref:hypothetical protein n=1 Tax=Thioclava sp. GXIMD4216 TaxID=3131929 RepID=UPI0030CB3D10
MPIKSMQGRGAPKAAVTCDQCGRTEVVPCDYTRDRPVAGQVLRKMQGQGWQVRKGKHLCPTCAARQRAASANTSKEDQMAQAEMRQPSREQKRDIIDALHAAYDVKAGRYDGGYTDKRVAEEIRNGILPGWVSEIREDLFGPDGGNQELVDLTKEIQDWKGNEDSFFARVSAVEKQLKSLRKDLHALSAREAALFNDLKKLQDDGQKLDTVYAKISARVDAVKAAVGPKAAKA